LQHTAGAATIDPYELITYQVDGSRRDFTVNDGTQYQFIPNNGGIDAVLPSATPSTPNPPTGTPATNPGGNTPSAVQNTPELYVKLAFAKATFEGNIARLMNDFNQLKALRKRSAPVTRDVDWLQLDAIAPSLLVRQSLHPGDFGKGLVTLTKGERQLVLDFNKE
jgi:hypothetical protein